jgi:hypothetical protein
MKTAPFKGITAAAVEKAATQPARPEQLLAVLAALVEKARERRSDLPIEQMPWLVRLSMTDAEYATFNRLLDEAHQMFLNTEAKIKETP